MVFTLRADNLSRLPMITTKAATAGALLLTASLLLPSCTKPPAPAEKTAKAPPAPRPGKLDSAGRPRNPSPGCGGFPARVYVPNTVSNTVDVIDPASFKVIEHFDVGRQPQHITPSYDLQHLWV